MGGLRIPPGGWLQGFCDPGQSSCDQLDYAAAGANANTGANAATTSQQTQLTADDVTKIIQQAQKSSSDPATTAINIFNGLGHNVSVSGDALRQGIKDSKVTLDDTSNALLANATSLSKNGNQVTINSKSETVTNISGNDVKVGPTVKFTVGSEKGNPTLGNISGFQVKKALWLDVQKVSVGPYQGGKAVFVQAGKSFAHATVAIPLP
jgi:hypothetical protein